jgi:phosphoribosylglycinamide formyltransferase-1
VSLQLGVLVSGSGSNLQAILDAIAAGELDAECRIVVSNRPEAFALERAKKSKVPTLALDHKSFESRSAFDVELARALKDAGVEWIALAGFMRVLTPKFLDAFGGKIINIHPSLLPAFPGVDAQRQAFESGVQVTGCTVHFVDHGVDTGPIIAQQEVPVLKGDDLPALRARILDQEHRLFVDALKKVASGEVQLTRTNESLG